MKPKKDTNHQHIARPSSASPISDASTTEPRLYRLKQVLQRIPVSRSTWFAGIKTGRFPPGQNWGPRVTVWHSEQIDNLISAFARTEVSS